MLLRVQNTTWTSGLLKNLLTLPGENLDQWYADIEQSAETREAVARAGITPGDMSYIEAHGTGTELGDPLEVSALGAVFGPGVLTPVRVKFGESSIVRSMLDADDVLTRKLGNRDRF